MLGGREGFRECVGQGENIGRDQRDFRQRDCTENRGAIRFDLFKPHCVRSFANRPLAKRPFGPLREYVQEGNSRGISGNRGESGGEFERGILAHKFKRGTCAIIQTSLGLDKNIVFERFKGGELFVHLSLY